jgi:RNA polymerase sigma factor (sigma-70 family)
MAAMSEVEYKGVPSDEPTPEVLAPPPRLTPGQALGVRDVVERTRNDVWRIAWSNSYGDRGLAEDGLQVTYLRLMEHWPGDLARRTETEQLYWLRGAARLVMLELFRKRAGGRVPGPEGSHRDRVVLSRDGDISALQGDEIRHLRESSGEQHVRDQVLEAVAETLKGQQREVIELMVKNLEDEEIAAHLGIKPGTVRSHRMLALAKLRTNPALRRYIKNKRRG